MRQLFFLSISLLVLSTLQGNTQVESSLREKRLPVSDTMSLDSLTIWPGSFVAKCPDGTAVSPSNYSLDPVEATLIWKKLPSCGYLDFSYRILPKSALGRYSKKDYRDYVNPESGFVIDPFLYRPENRAAVFDLDGFTYSGNLERGFSIGNSQNLSFNSAFNLQLQGQIAKGVTLTAVLTDNNIPIQPEGNTQLLQEFDQVFIELKSPEHRVVLGDYRVRNPAGYFLKYNKRLQGGRYEGRISLADSNVIVSPQASVAFSGGKFSRNEFRGEEGNQGPYRLRGANDEPFIIILAGTERVYINGNLLARGADQDYIIDYNTAELRFTPNQIITQDLRIVVEFEYSVQSYAHNTFHVGSKVEVSDWGFDVHFYSEQDNKNRPLNQQLTVEDQRFLQNLGDDIQNAQAPGQSPVSFDPDRILYELIDTSIGTITYDSVFRAIDTSTTEIVYAVSFSFVGLGAGDYRIASSGVNGRVYEWVAPIDGVSQGEYAPVKTLISPKQNQMLTLGLSHKNLGGGKLSLEGALSIEDLNTFSRLDNDDNAGWSGRADYQKHWGKEKGKGLSSQIFYEYRASEFRRIERYREVEFQRNYGLEELNDTLDEHWGGLGLNFGMGEKGQIGVKGSGFFRAGKYSAFHGELNGQIESKGWRLRLNSNMLAATNTLFARPFFDISYAPSAMKGWRLGLDVQNEWNVRRRADTLVTGSFIYQQYKAYAESPKDGALVSGFSYMLRYEHYEDGIQFSGPLVRTHTAKFNGQLSKNPRHKIRWTASYRYYEDDRSSKTTELNNFYLGRLRYDGVSKKPWIRWNTLYEVGAGQRQRTEFAYIRVQDGQGDYQWIDNGDGIPTQDEFFISPFQDQNDFVRVLTPTGEFVPVTEAAFNQVLAISPAVVWNNEQGVKGFISRFSNQATIQLNKAVFADPAINTWEALSPVAFGVPDSALAGLDVLARNTLFFNRNDPRFQLEYTAGLVRNKQLQTNGFEERRLQNHRIGFRWNFYRNFSLNGQFDNSILSNSSDFFEERRYTIHQNGFQAGLSYLKGNTLKLDLRYRYNFQSNAFPVNGGQFAVGHRVDIEGKVKRVGKSTVTGRFTIHQLGFSDPYNNAQVEFQMLQNLKPGTNLVWQIVFERQLTDFLQMSVSYDGRLPAGNKAVHVGRAQVRAVF